MAARTVPTNLENFAANFNPGVYRDLTASLHDSNPISDYNRHFAEMIHHVFAAHSPGDTLLEIGSGPGIRNVMSASAKYQSITLSDPVPGNRRFLEQYMEGEEPDDTWIDHYQFIAQLEGNSEQWTQVRSRLRSSITRVLDCDIVSDEPLGSNHGVYDCVMAVLCLEAASTDLETYAKAMKNLVSLAKPGGAIVLGGVLGGSFYVNAGNCFPSLPVTSEVVLETAKEAGCTVLEIETKKLPSCLPITDMEGIYMMTAKKN